MYWGSRIIHNKKGINHLISNNIRVKGVTYSITLCGRKFEADSVRQFYSYFHLCNNCIRVYESQL